MFCPNYHYPAEKFSAAVNEQHVIAHLLLWTWPACTSLVCDIHISKLKGERSVLLDKCSKQAPRVPHLDPVIMSAMVSVCGSSYADCGYAWKCVPIFLSLFTKLLHVWVCVYTVCTWLVVTLLHLIKVWIFFLTETPLSRNIRCQMSLTISWWWSS